MKTRVERRAPAAGMGSPSSSSSSPPSSSGSPLPARRRRRWKGAVGGDPIAIRSVPVGVGKGGR
uniref:Uncharacterized protein n=1 Tax=Arundo donax TaxID=35708 RepID=A0A0A9FFM3_ARUDO